MKAWHYEGYTTPDGGVICTDCTGELTEEQEEEKGYHPIFADSEWDGYPSCDECLRKLDYVNLTSDGEEYEREQEKRNAKYTMKMRKKASRTNKPSFKLGTMR